MDIFLDLHNGIKFEVISSLRVMSICQKLPARPVNS